MTSIARVPGAVAAMLVSALTLPLPLAAYADGFDDGNGAYVAHNLVSDGSVAADHTDANLVNAWGIAFNPTGPVWISDNGTNLSTLYDGTGTIVNLVVAIPGANGSADPGAPTGIVFSASTFFPVTKTTTTGPVTGPARFLFATEQGTIAGWAPNVDLTHAITVVDNSATGAIYKGLALSGAGSGPLLYATDFHNRRVDVFDGAYHPVTISGAFVDTKIPLNFAPFGIQAINGDIYVTYAQQDSEGHDDVHGRGLGFVDVFDPSGKLLQRLATRGVLNAPWGLTLAPAGFGAFGNRLLVGNFGDGHINAFDAATGRWLGTISGANHRALQIDGLWGLAFGNGFASQQIDSLYFTAGPGDEEHGVYGRITPAVSSVHKDN
jgi:uncharacterized protein (TIGR03118 family)